MTYRLSLEIMRSASLAIKWHPPISPTKIVRASHESGKQTPRGLEGCETIILNGLRDERRRTRRILARAIKEQRVISAAAVIVQ